MSADHFQQALASLVNDEDFRRRVEEDPKALTRDYSLDADEVLVLARAGAVAGQIAATGDTNCCCCCCA